MTSRSLRSLFVALALLAAFAATAQTPRFAPAPAWVDIAPLPDAADAAPTSDGTRYLLLDDQVDARTGTPAWFRRIATRLDGSRALADGGQITIDFQPDYQRVVVHTVDVVRNGVRTDRRKDARVQVLRREEDLDSAMFDGTHTATLTVPDLRVGDIVDYSYSVVGDNPVFGDAYYDVYTARFGSALAWRRVRALYGTLRPLQARVTAPGYSRRDGVLAKGGARVGQGEQRFMEFTARRVPRIREEPEMADSFDPYGRIELSTARNWADVSRWAAPLYRGRFDDRALAAELSRALRLDDPDKRAALLRAIAFVEGEIRYTALDMGKNSHEPNAPETVVARRFGDCKDKSVLLVALLHEAGIAAESVLVDTGGRESLAERLPSAVVFDHVVVRAHLDGQALWIDPTRDPESGALADRSPLPFRLGLPICADCDRLVEIPQPMPRAPVIEVGQYIDVASTPTGYRADFTVVTDYRNERADSVRDLFADGEEDVGKSYLSYMRKYYDGLRSGGTPFLRERDKGGGGVRTTEHYTLRRNQDEGSELGVVLFQLLDWVPEFDLDARQTPIVLGGPVFGRQTIRTAIGGRWNIAPEQDTVANKYFEFTRTVRHKDRVLEITGTWRRLADAVPAADYARVRDDVDRVRDLMQYDVDLGGESDADNARPAWRLLALILLGFIFVLAWWGVWQAAELRRLRTALGVPPNKHPKA